MSDSEIQVFEGTLTAPQGAAFAIVAARFNELVVDPLIEGAIDTLVRHGVPRGSILVTKAPGAYELPVVCQRLAASGKVAAVIALGAVIRGATPHFDYVAGEAAKGCGTVATSTGVPVVFGVLTTDTIEQAVERAGTKAGNKGADCALAAIEMVNLGRTLGDAGY
ncbi:MAG: 6,7-dimethyl-8-ribityllumazine synthase [Myxococcales bacterium]|nr:6,7-dimethyl-8-ribityllumazine synthase [Myxococcales bacterium]